VVSIYLSYSHTNTFIHTHIHAYTMCVGFEIESKNPTWREREKERERERKMMFYRAMSMGRNGRMMNVVLPRVRFTTNTMRKRPTTIFSASRRKFRSDAAVKPQKREIEWTAENIGRASLGTAGIVGIGALCWYGLGMADQPGAAEYSYMWPDYIRKRVRHTFAYFGGGLAVTAGAAATLYTSGVANRFMAKSPMMFLGVTFVGTIGTMMATMAIDYQSTVAKHAAWLAFNTAMGLSLVPICSMGGPLLARAAVYTGITVGGLCAIAACAPNDKFLNMGGALSIGLGVMVVSSLGSLFLPATSAAVPIIHSLSLYGGTILFSGFVLYDVQKIILHAEQDESVPYDPINHSIGIYMDTINLFIRIAQILQSTQGGRRK